MAREGIERRLAAILAADVVGYSLFMAEAEEGTLRTLNFYRVLSDSVTTQHEGCVFGAATVSLIANCPSRVGLAKPPKIRDMGQLSD